MVAPGPRPLSPPGPRPRTHLDLVVLVAFKVKAAAIKRAALPAAAASIACWPCCDRVIACPSSSARRNTRPAAPTVRPAGCCRTETHTAAACHHPVRPESEREHTQTENSVGSSSMGRAPCCDKTSVKRGPWSPEEDELLRSYVHNHGTGGNWIALPHKAGLNRCGKSCRLRWLNYLRPDIKHGGYTEQEDRIICSLYNSIGSRWSIIASKLPGRTDNDVKNYWNTKLKKKAIANMQQQQEEYYHHHQQHSSGGGRGRRGGAAAAVTPRAAPRSQQCASSMQPSPASASSAVTTASASDACSFGAMYPSPSTTTLQAAAPVLARYDGTAPAPPLPPPPPQQQQQQQASALAEFSPAPAPATAISGTWAAGLPLDDMFLPELLGDSEFPPGGDFFGTGFAPLLLQDRAASASLQELSACYFPNAQAEMWAAADHHVHVKPPAGLCHSLT
ncbi:uncharacterized protein LOC8068029 [Sorghum bicolor]|nr:uncharacterized protein LOC8068029 [Sorghum bicolor]|eukprot:XP_021311318.1 uncharacterized protein LOC8068029 [Sorghum bicolor]